MQVRRGGVDRIIVRVERRFENGTGVMGLNNIELLRDVSFAPNDHKRIWGEVVALPMAFSEDRVFLQYSKEPERFAYYSDVPMDIQVGDKAYFSYLSVDDSTLLGRDDEEKWELFAIDIKKIICVVRYQNIRADGLPVDYSLRMSSFCDFACGEIHIDSRMEQYKAHLLMFGGYMLLEKTYDKSGEYEVKPNEYGVMEKRSKGGIIMLEEVKQTSVMIADDPDDINDFERNKSSRFKYEVKPIPGRGKVVKVGALFKNRRSQIKEGDVVQFKAIFQFENVIEGKAYWCVRQTDVDAIELNG